MSLYNNNTGSNARQLLNWVNGLNLLNIGQQEFNTLGSGLMRTLQEEMKLGKATNNANRYNSAQNMIQELNSLTPDKVTPNVIKILASELVKLLTNQIQESNIQQGGLFQQQNGNMFGQQQNNNIAFGGNTNQGFNNSFGTNVGGGFNNTNAPQVAPSATFKSAPTPEPVVNNNIQSPIELPKELTLEDVERLYMPYNGNEYRPLYDDTLYTLWYELNDNNEYKYILVEKGE